MATVSISSAKIVGISAIVPRNVAHNADLPFFDEAEIRRLVQTTGIEHRRIVPSDVCTSDLCLEGARALMKELGWSPESVNGIVFVSQTPDYIVPATACILQNRLGLPKNSIAFDVNLGCSGYTYGLSIAAGLLSSAKLGRVLLMAGDTPSKTTSAQDRSALPLFGDAASVTALEYDEAAAPMVFHFGTDGSGYKAIIIPAGQARDPASEETLKSREVSPGIVRNGHNVSLDGVEIFNFTLREVAASVSEVMRDAGQSVETVDAFVFHQANKIINETLRKKLKVPPEKFPSSLKDFGNTSSASIPMTLVTQSREKLMSGRSSLLLSGFGVGLSWCSCHVVTDSIKVPVLVELP